MAKFDITIDNLFNGQAPTYFKGGSYLSSYGIDPGKKINGKTGGVITPTSIENIQTLDGNVMFAVPNPYTSNTLLYTDTGWLYLVDENNQELSVDEAGNTFPRNLSGYGTASGNGLVFYNNYYYILKDTDIDRYGPFTDTANLALETNWWTSLYKKSSVAIRSSAFSGGTGPIAHADYLEQLTTTKSFPLYGEDEDGYARSVAQKINVDSTETVTLKKFDVMFGMFNTGDIGSQVGDLRISIQTGTGAGTSMFPSGTRLREITIPIRTIDSDSPDFVDVNFSTIFPNGTVLANLEFDTAFEWDPGTYTDLFLVFEVLNTTSLSQGAFILGADLGATWETQTNDVWSGWAVQEVYDSGGASWAWELVGAATEDSLFFRFYTEEPLMAPLENPDYSFFLGELPNHSSHVHRADNNLYYPNASNVGRIQTRDSMLLGYLGSFLAGALPLIPGNTIVGETSGARATIVNTVANETDLNETIASNSAGSGYPTNVSIVVEVTEGEFVIGERLMNLENYPYAKLLEFKHGFYTGQFTNPAALVLPKTKGVTDISSYGIDLAVLTHQNNGDAFESSMILWDAVSPQFTREVPIRNNLGTAIFSGLGSVNVFYGDEEGYSLGTYVGGERFSNLFYRDDSHPPYPGAIITEYDRVMWGTKQTYPEPRLSVLSYGMLDSTLPKGVHNLYSVDVDAVATAVTKYPNLGIFSDKVYIENAGDPYYDGKVTTSRFRTSMYTINEPFDVKTIRFSLERPVDAFTGIEVRVYYDNESRSELVATISDAKFVNKRVITLKPNYGGFNNFFVEFRYTGDDNGILLPINMTVETKPTA